MWWGIDPELNSGMICAVEIGSPWTHFLLFIGLCVNNIGGGVIGEFRVVLLSGMLTSLLPMIGKFFCSELFSLLCSTKIKDEEVNKWILSGKGKFSVCSFYWVVTKPNNNYFL